MSNMDKVLAQVKLMCPTPILLLPSIFCYSIWLTAFREHKAIKIIQQFIACCFSRKQAVGPGQQVKLREREIRRGSSRAKVMSSVMTSDLRVETVSYHYCFYTPC